MIIHDGAADYDSTDGEYVEYIDAKIRHKTAPKGRPTKKYDIW